VVLGDIEIPKQLRGLEAQLALRFESRHAALIAELDGCPVDINPIGRRALERVYL